MVALDLLEQMHAQTLELIGANAQEYSLAGGGKIRLERIVRERAHGEMCGGDRLE